MKTKIITLIFFLLAALNSHAMLTVLDCKNCTPKELARVQESASMVNQVVKTQCFRDFMEARELIQTNGLTRSQVVDSLVSADIKISVEMYWSLKRVLGYTYDGVNKEWVNRRYMMSWGVCDLASLLGHETSHKANYDHDFKATKRRPWSVPYSINQAFKKCCPR